jgi:hypothetical protein
MKIAFAIAFIWALVPLLPAILQSDLAGSPYTDLYPSVWSLWATENWIKNDGLITLLNHPSGTKWYPNSLITGLLAQPILWFLSISSTFNLLLFVSRFATTFSFYLAAGAFGIQHSGRMFFMVLVGCSPFLHGFAVEGIIEGCNAWAIGFWLWAIGNKRYHLAIVFFLLGVLSNWYYGAVLCLLCICFAVKDRKVLLSFIGLILCIPFVSMFLESAGQMIQIPSDIRQKMGFQWGVPTPNLLSDNNPFAITTYLGWITIIAAFTSQKKYLWFALIPFILSIGWPFLYNFPILEWIRFPYRWHIATLIFLGLAGGTAQIITKYKWIPYLLLLENILLSPIDFILPSSSSEYPAYVSKINGPILELPGPLYRLPGDINPSRPRNKRILYYQTKHQQPSGWSLDFNGLQETSNCFAETRMIDPHSTPDEKNQQGSTTCWESIQWVVIHNGSDTLHPLLNQYGFTPVLSNEKPQLWQRVSGP